MLKTEDIDAVNIARNQLKVIAQDPRVRFAGVTSALEQLERALRLLQERDAFMASTLLHLANQLRVVASSQGIELNIGELNQLMLRSIAEDVHG